MNTLKLSKLRSDLFIKLCRSKSSLGLWSENITTEIKHKIEQHWAEEVLHNESPRKASYYILPMFPYPSGKLHMGHVRVYSISDTIARFNKCEGHSVIHPIGWDAFGLPAENAALEHHISPLIWTTMNIDTMKKQLIQLGFNFDWKREINTCDPQYYKWTQYIFLKLFEKGLAYQSKAKVNWDPVDKTVLADEQVDDSGCSWRSGARVEKKILTQWFIKTTEFAKRLYDGLDSKHLENWKDIINLQKHWIGECNGTVIHFNIKIGNRNKVLDVWSADPYKFIYGDYIAMHKDHVVLMELTNEEIDNLKCYNPLTETEMKIYITDDANYPEGREEYIVCPSIDPADRNLSIKLNIPIISETTTMPDISVENKRVIEMAQKKNCGGHYVSSKLKDWLISRQRYWGTPIPIIHCPKCGIVPVPHEELPVKLPEDKSSKNIKSCTLSHFESWVHCKCPHCSGSAQRETDTMDTFVDSSWYYYRFLDPNNDNMPFDKNKFSNNVPVHCYIGGKEHAVLHLYYARFMSYFLHSIGLSPSEEPFKKLLVQGMIMGQSYKLKSSGKYMHPESVEKVGKNYKVKETGEPVVVQWEKMSKSKHNGENPERLISTYGCDTTRLLVLADVPPATSRKWSDATLPGVLNWQHRLWITIREFLQHRNSNELQNSVFHKEKFQEYESKLWHSRNYFIATATYHFKYTQKLSVGISRLQSLTSVLRNKIPPEVIAKSKEYERALAALIIMLSPITPHFGSELWSGFISAPHKVCETSNFIDWEKQVLDQKWPTVDKNFPLSFQCKVDGYDACEHKVEAAKLPDITAEKALQIMLNENSVSRRVKRGIYKTEYDLYPDCRAVLRIFTHQSVNLKAKTEADCVTPASEEKLKNSL